MSDTFILDRNHLPYWLRQLRKERKLIGPMRKKSGDIVYEEVSNIHEIELNCPAILPPVKEFFFPATEAMLRFKKGNVNDNIMGTPAVIFGLRSCDVSALNLVDRFFGGDIKDRYYTKKRENTLLVSVGCNMPDPTCFCMSMGTGPFLHKGYDIQLTDLGDRYFVEARSGRAKNIMNKFRHLFGKPSKADYEDQYEAVHLSQTYFEKRINLEGARNAIVSGAVHDDFWRSVTARCFECGGCVYECPLCTCFNVIDRKYDGTVERARVWDTCMFKGFTRMTGGVLPNRDRIRRTKRWYYHKIVYGPEQIGTFGCVGCGRCTITCPGVIDMATVGMKLSKGVDNS
ncbi:anaerobic sulfite reductase subunit A [bacterium BMS3Abin07]|nr:anaerobic sulfite reductase subunit A [bacterium BMS3Abin07]GBE31752.1 anaerobic sulfite reductase subunit A [bacterium BMS3Bbin05]HDL20285.1 hypothetical protein [Nitrospirota bacterium]HDO23380.1 hypothetical protein [Nitrospirota bacterium]